MPHRALAAVATLTTLSFVPAVAVAQGKNPPRTAWGDPDVSGLWTNATLTVLPRPPELASKEFFTPEEAARFEHARVEQTNADRPARPGEVGAYSDAFFERGTRTRGPLFEVACHEGNYGMGFILSGHRAEERAEAGRRGER